MVNIHTSSNEKTKIDRGPQVNIVVGWTPVTIPRFCLIGSVIAKNKFKAKHLDKVFKKSQKLNLMRVKRRT